MAHPEYWLALSGGVDSAVAGWLLKRRGVRLTGVFMKNYAEDEGGFCPWREDQESAQAVAEFLDIPFQSVNFERQYRARVLDIFFKEYAAGLTPNPDVLCNREIKFSLFADAARADGAAGIVTGHYARISRRAGRVYLQHAIDQSKDQSYFLSLLNEEQLRFAHFPLGSWKKERVRVLAKKIGLPNAERPDSQGICFIGERNIVDFLQQRIPRTPGPIVSLQGEVLGQHQGLPFYTVGQRSGIGVASSEPLYVAAKQPEMNALVVAPRSRPEVLLRSSLLGAPVHWVNGQPAMRPFRARIRIRHLQTFQDATVIQRPDGAVQIDFDEPQRAITPGQYAMISRGQTVLGAVKIVSPIPAW
jgi:tRNA-specific 2-thiouridylase